MSAPYAKLPGWVDYGVIPLVNLVVAFLVAGLVVLLVGESPIRAAALLIEGAFGYGEGIGFTLYYATYFAAPSALLETVKLVKDICWMTSFLLVLLEWLPRSAGAPGAPDVRRERCA